jgi:hypothetical protein
VDISVWFKDIAFSVKIGELDLLTFIVVCILILAVTFVVVLHIQNHFTFKKMLRTTEECKNKVAVFSDVETRGLIPWFQRRLKDFLGK